MRIGCLQFAPKLGDVNNNLNRADAVLSKANLDHVDVLVLPELAFSGYSFKSEREIAPFVEPCRSGITSLWARTVALKYDCNVIVGYPERVDAASGTSANFKKTHPPPPPLNETLSETSLEHGQRREKAHPTFYNSAILVNEDGDTLANCRKACLLDNVQSLALEHGNGLYHGFIPRLGHTCISISIDFESDSPFSSPLPASRNAVLQLIWSFSLSPCKQDVPWHAYELAYHVLDTQSRLVIVTMAWMTDEDPRLFSRMPAEPDMGALSCWLARLEPLIRAELAEETIVVFCNRAGSEGSTLYSGTSTIIGIQEGEVKVYGHLGRGDKDLLVVDTDREPCTKLIYRPENDVSGPEGNSVAPVPMLGRELSHKGAEQGPTDDQGQSQHSLHDCHPLAAENRQSTPPEWHITRTSTGYSLPSIPSGPPMPPEPGRAMQGRPMPSQPSLETGTTGQGIDIIIAASTTLPTPSAINPTPRTLRPKIVTHSVSLFTASQRLPQSAAPESQISLDPARSNGSDLSVQTAKFNPRPPEDSTPYPHDDAPPTGFYSKSFIYGGRGANPTLSNHISPSARISPTSPLRLWKPADSRIPPTPISNLGQSQRPTLDPALEDIINGGLRSSQLPDLVNNLLSNSTSATVEMVSRSDKLLRRPPSPKSRNAGHSLAQGRPRLTAAEGRSSMWVAATNDLEMLPSRPRSRIGLHERSHSFTETAGWPTGCPTPSPLSSHPVSSHHTSLAGRGRPGMVITQPDRDGTRRVHSADSLATQVNHGSSQRQENASSRRSQRHGHERSRQAHDFERFEAIICRSCPVHGQRPATNEGAVEQKEDEVGGSPAPDSTSDYQHDTISSSSS